MLQNYKTWLIQKGYSTTTQNNKPSTVYDYMTSLVRVCHWESKTVEQLAESISTILPPVILFQVLATFQVLADTVFYPDTILCIGTVRQTHRSCFLRAKRL